MKALNLFLLLLMILSTTQAKIIDESQVQNGLVPTESVTTQESKVTVEEEVEEPLCFHADINAMCFNKTGSETKPSCECEQYPENDLALVCCNVTDIYKAISCVGNTSSYNHIHIINLVQKELNVGKLNNLKHVDSLIITDGNITKVTGEFSAFSMIKCLNFSNNNITEINERALKHLRQLQILDLSANNLTKLPTPPAHSKVDVRGNLKISCKNVSSALARNVSFLYQNITSCEVETVYVWFNSTATIFIENMEKVKQLDDECPTGCRCAPNRMFYSSENELVFLTSVDCSNLGLTELPPILPEHTLSLNISNNSITSLAALSDNKNYYSDIKYLYADDNLIKSIEDLEGSKFLENFTKLFLKNNKIKDIPTYILSNLERNLNGKLVFLGGNRIQCDCQTYKNQRVSLFLLFMQCMLIYDALFLFSFGDSSKITTKSYATT